MHLPSRLHCRKEARFAKSYNCYKAQLLLMKAKLEVIVLIEIANETHDVIFVQFAEAVLSEVFAY
jgi:hypothetical protein